MTSMELGMVKLGDAWVTVMGNLAFSNAINFSVLMGRANMTQQFLPLLFFVCIVQCETLGGRTG